MEQILTDSQHQGCNQQHVFCKRPISQARSTPCHPLVKVLVKTGLLRSREARMRTRQVLLISLVYSYLEKIYSSR